jgi:serine phosphatase RsbU (regulator of sigma subunit)
MEDGHSVTAPIPSSIEEYFRERLTPVDSAIPHLAGIEMYGASIPAGNVGGDLFEYINFLQRYNIDARIASVLQLANTYLEPLSAGQPPRNTVDDHVLWLRCKSEAGDVLEAEYRRAKSSEQRRVAENLHELYTTAGVLLVDAQGHSTISAKIASTVHSTFHAFMLSELDRYGTTTTELFEHINLRMAHSVTARNELGREQQDFAREIATMIYGEIRPSGHLRFVNFGSPPPLKFSAKSRCFVAMDTDHLVQFPALGLEIPQDHPDRNKYLSMAVRQRQINSSDVAEIALMNLGDIVFLYSDGVYDGSDGQGRLRLECIIRDHQERPAKDICHAILDYALKQDEHLQQIGEEDRIDDKTVFIIKHD